MSTIHHAAVFVSDLERSAAFYGELLGLSVTDRATLDALGIEQAFLSGGERHADLVLARRLDGTTPPETPQEKRELFHLAFELPADVPFDRFAERVAQQGVTVAAGPMEHPSLADGSGSRDAIYLLDPDGYLFEVTSER